MNDPVEAYRGGVVIQECDAFGHLNIAYYVERFADAAWELMRRLAPGTRWRTHAINTRYLTELRAGDPIAISTGIIAIDAATLTLGHVATNGMGGAPTTIAEQVLVLDAPDGEAWAEQRAALTDRVAAWTQPGFDPIVLPDQAGPVASGLSRVKPWEAGEAGRLSLFGFVDRFSTANLVNMNAAGMSSTYMRAEKRGFATFETRMELFAPMPAVGDGVAIASGMIEIGKSSVRILHEMRLSQGGRRVARFYQAGVHFDLEARRSTPLPDALRARARGLLIASSS
jgi:acyl-CoA thioesterase FadM